MQTKADNYRTVIDLRNQIANDDEFIRKVAGVIALNDLDKDNPPLATILDFDFGYYGCSIDTVTLCIRY